MALLSIASSYSLSRSWQSLVIPILHTSSNEEVQSHLRSKMNYSQFQETQPFSSPGFSLNLFLPIQIWTASRHWHYNDSITWWLELRSTIEYHLILGARSIDGLIQQFHVDVKMGRGKASRLEASHKWGAHLPSTLNFNSCRGKRWINIT